MELQIIQNKIFDIKGIRVMLDFHLAELYGVETRTLKQAVKRNIDRFPSDFMFELSREDGNEIIRLGVSQNVIPPGYNTGSSLIMVFSEQGVAMLSSILRSKTAIQINISIMRAFVAIRQLIISSPSNTELKKEMNELKEYIEEVFTDYNDINEDTRTQLELMNEALAELQVKYKAANKPRRPVGFNVNYNEEIE